VRCRRGGTRRFRSGIYNKYKIIEEKGAHPTLSVLYTATIPTATAEVGAGAVGHSAGILASKDFGKHHFDFNETAQWLGRPGATGFDRDYFTALAYSRGVSRGNATLAATMTIMGAAT